MLLRLVVEYFCPDMKMFYMDVYVPELWDSKS